MSKLSKAIALALLAVMSVTSVPETVLAKNIADSKADNAYMANDDEEPAKTPEQDESSEKPAEKPTEKTSEQPTEKPAEKPAEDTEKEPDKEPSDATGETPSDADPKESEKEPEQAPEDKSEEKPSEVKPEAPSGNTDEEPSGDKAGEDPKQDAAPVDPVDTIPIVEGTWGIEAGKKVFIDKSGNRVTGFCFIGEKLYFFNEEGIMKTGWLLLTDGTRRYFNSDGSGIINSWKKIGKAKYHFDETGVMAVGLKTIGGKIYFFDSTGKMRTGWVTTGGKKYYFDKKNGSAYTNKWFKYKKKKYHFDTEGVMAKGLTHIGSNLYFFNSKGQMKKGWVTTGGKKYYFDKKGKAYVNRWLKKRKKKYHFDTEGVMAKGLTHIGSNLYFFNSKGQMKKGWVTTCGKKYYFDKKGKAYVNKWLTYKKKKYYFNSEGVMSSGPVVIGGQTYYFDSNGKLKTGWITINGERYYCDKNGKRYVNKWLTYNKHKYYFNSEGHPVTDLQIIDNHIYYFDSTGIMKTGWMTINGITYYFRSSGAAATGGWYWIGEDRYYFGTEGNMYRDTIIDGIEIGPDGRAIIEEDDDDDDDDENEEINSFSQVVIVGTFDEKSRTAMSAMTEVSCHVLGYKDPGYGSGKVTVSGWTYCALSDNSHENDRFFKAEEFDMNKYLNGGYGNYSLYFCCLPGEKVTLTVVPSDEFCDFLGWSKKSDSSTGAYDENAIFSTSKSITVSADNGYGYYAHCNSPWNAAFVDLTYSNSGKRKFTVHHLMCHRNKDGVWRTDEESDRIVSNVAFYHTIFSNYGGPVMNPRTCYGFFMRDENTKFSTEGVYVTILKDERGRETGAKQYIHTWKYDLNENDLHDTFALMDEDGKIILKIAFYDETTFKHIDPLTGDWLDQFEDPELLKYVHS